MTKTTSIFGIKAMVVMVTCLNEHWKIPLAYYFIYGMSCTEPAKLLRKCLIRSHETKIDTVNITFDGAHSNIAMSRTLGANLFPMEKDFE